MFVAAFLLRTRGNNPSKRVNGQPKPLCLGERGNRQPGSQPAPGPEPLAGCGCRGVQAAHRSLGAGGLGSQNGKALVHSGTLPSNQRLILSIEHLRKLRPVPAALPTPLPAARMFHLETGQRPSPARRMGKPCKKNAIGITDTAIRVHELPTGTTRVRRKSGPVSD